MQETAQCAAFPLFPLFNLLQTGHFAGPRPLTLLLPIAKQLSLPIFLAGTITSYRGLPRPRLCTDDSVSRHTVTSAKQRIGSHRALPPTSTWKGCTG
jgi:hypothetical protein